MTEPKILHLWTQLDFTKIGKNRQHAINPHGKKKIVNTNKDFMDKLIYEIAVETKVQKIKWENVKTWLFVFVSKVSEKGDYLNVIDVLSDVIKVAIDVDDNKFSAIIDGEVKKGLPYPAIHFYIIQADEKQIIELAMDFMKGNMKIE